MAGVTVNREDERPPLPPMVRLPRLSAPHSNEVPPVEPEHTLGKPGVGKHAKLYLSGTVKDAARLTKKTGRNKALSHDEGVNELLHLRHHYRHLNAPVDVMKTRGFHPKYPGKGVGHLEDYVTDSSSQTVSNSAEILHGNPNVYRESLSQQLDTARHLQSHHRRIEQASTTVNCWHTARWYSYNKRQEDIRKGSSRAATARLASENTISLETSPTPGKISRTSDISRTTSPRMMSPTGTKALPVERMQHLLEGTLDEPWGPAARGCPVVPIDPDPVFSGALLGASIWEHGHRQFSPRTSPPKRPEWLTPEPVVEQEQLTADQIVAEKVKTEAKQDPQQEA